MLSRWTAFILFIACMGFPPSLLAAGNDEVTVVPVGTAPVEKGAHNVSYLLPMGPEGPLAQAMVLIASQPSMKVTATPLSPDNQPREGEEPMEQVPATLKFKLGEAELPIWELQKQATAYVINLDAIKANPDHAKGRLAMNIELTTAADGLAVSVLGMPDPLLANSSTNGPLASLANAARDPEVQSLLQALVLEVSAQKPKALAEYERLRNAKNEKVARLARRAVRMLSYDLRKRKLSGNFMEHYRWGLYLQQCGLFGAAFREFEECRIIFPWRADTQFRAGEMFERTGGPAYTLLDYLDRTAEAAPRTQSNNWYVLVTILRQRGDRKLSSQEVYNIKDNWLAAERCITGATNGRLRLITSFYDVRDEQQIAYEGREGDYFAPTANLVEVRGWFDSVISITPRLPSDNNKPRRTFSNDVGLNGAGLTCLFHDTPWPEFTAAINDQLSEAARASELDVGFLWGNQVTGAGHQPAPSVGYAARAALYYHLPQYFIPHLKMNDLPQPGNYLGLWRVEGPYPIKDQAPAQGLPKRHVLDALDAEPEQTEQIVSEDDFVDLKKLFPNAGWALARATTWVYSPTEQTVRMWLGRNDGLAVWVNSRLVYAGRQYAAGEFEDRNLVDTVASYAELKNGWNEIRVVVESWPAPRDQGWGFSVRLCDLNNNTPPGLASVYEHPDEDLVPAYAPPPTGPYYLWTQAQADYLDILPSLTSADLAAITGIKDLHVDGFVDRLKGYAAVLAPDLAEGTTYRVLKESWRVDKDSDSALNNVLDWSREACAALRYQKNGAERDLLFIKPEAFEAFTTDLIEPAATAKLFEGKSPAQRILGYVLVPAANEGTRVLFVIDSLLSDKSDADRSVWPVDEEDLLTPFGPEIWNASLLPMGPLP